MKLLNRKKVREENITYLNDKNTIYVDASENERKSELNLFDHEHDLNSISKKPENYNKINNKFFDYKEGKTIINSFKKIKLV